MKATKPSGHVVDDDEFFPCRDFATAPGDGLLRKNVSVSR